MQKFTFAYRPSRNKAKRIWLRTCSLVSRSPPFCLSCFDQLVEDSYTLIPIRPPPQHVDILNTNQKTKRKDRGFRTRLKKLACVFMIPWMQLFCSAKLELHVWTTWESAVGTHLSPSPLLLSPSPTLGRWQKRAGQYLETDVGWG